MLFRSKLAYAGVGEVSFDGAQHRTDIAAAALAGKVRAASEVGEDYPET